MLKKHYEILFYTPHITFLWETAFTRMCLELWWSKSESVLKNLLNNFAVKT